MKNLLQKIALGLCVFAVLTVNAQIKPVNVTTLKAEKPSALKKVNAKPTELKGNNVENLRGTFPVNTCKKNTQVLPSAESVMGSIIFSEDFGGGIIPFGWEALDNTGEGPWEWKASFASEPFNSISNANGFMMVNSDGAGSGKTQDAELITTSFNCVGKSVIILNFQDHFRQWGSSVGEVFVSSNKVNWNSVYIVGPALAQDEQSANPGSQSIDISSFAANKPSVFLKFKYTGAYDYWWMIDDISVEEVVPYDGRILEITSPVNTCSFADGTPVSIKIVNEGTDVMSGFDVGYSLDGGPMIVESPGLVLNPGDTVTYDFTSAADLAGATTHTLSAEILWPQDNAQGNNKMEISIKEYLKDISASPLVNSFNSMDDLEGWLISDNNGDNRTYHLSSGFNGPAGTIEMLLSSTLIANDWLFTSCVYLEAGKDYSLSYDYITAGKTHSVRISYGTSPDSAGQSIILDDIPVVNNTTFMKYIKVFQVSVSDIYYFGILDYGGTGEPPRWLNIDNFAIMQMGTAEAGISNIVAPVSACDLTSSESVTITINNLGVNDLTGFDVSYSINGGTPVNENVGNFSISPGVSADYTFTTPADLSSTNNFTLGVSLVVPGDINNFNDTLSVKLRKLKTDLTTDTLLEQFNDKLPEGWKVMNIDYPDSASWLDTYTIGGNNVMILQIRQDGGANDWVFSQCVNIEAGSYYKIGFRYWNETASTHNLDLALASSQDDLGTMYPVFSPFDITTSQIFKDTATVYQATETGYFYIGVHCSAGTAGKFVAFDDLNMVKLSQNDLELVSVIAPKDGTCEFSNADDITVTVRNNGIMDINTFDISYKIDGGTPVTETVNQVITLGSTYDYTFTTKADLSVKDNYAISVSGNLSGDSNQKNDSASAVVFETITYISPDSIFEGFASGIPFGYTIQNYDNPTVASWYPGSFTSGNAAIFFETDGTGAADDWLFTSCVYLEQGANYVSGFRYWNTNDDSTHSISLQLCTSPDKSTAQQALIGPFDFANTSFFKDTSYIFTVPSSGIYYLAIACHGSIGPNALMAIDNFILFKTAANDIGIASATSPVTGPCTLGSQEQVAVTLVNEGVNQITTYDVTFIVDGVVTFTEPGIDVLDPGFPAPAVPFNFGSNADLSVQGPHEIKVFVTLAGDENPLNDTLVFTVYSVHKDLETEEIHNNFETVEERAGWSSEMSGQNPLWFPVSSPTMDNSSLSLAFVSDSGATPNAWYFSPCINVVGGNTYAISFFYVDNVSSSEKFNLKIAMGGAPDATAMTEDIMDNGSVSSINDYTKVTYSFLPANSGDYYIGIQVYGNPDTAFRYISLENIYLYKPAPPTAMFSSKIDQFDSLVVYFYDESLGGSDSWAWDFGDSSAIDTLQNPIHLFPDKTVATYQICLTVTNSFGQNTYCDSLTIYGTVSINDKLPVTNELAYYPIPANSMLTVKFKGENPAVKSIRILNLVGQVINSAIITNTSTYNINTSDLSVGFYYLQIITDKEVINKKLMINR